MGFIFGGKTGETQESIKRKRDYAQALMAAKGAPRDVGEGLNSLGNAIAYRMALSQIGKGEAAIAEKNSALMAPIVESFGGGAQQFPEPPASPDAPKEIASYSPDGSMAGKIAETAQALGIDPVDLGTAISYETAGTFDPTKKGPTTQWGQHRGLIQFGEPQAKKYGVDWSDPVGSQLGPNGAVAKYLRDTGVKPGMGMMDIYSAINAGGVGKYGASDANNGGAPGTVADKVNSQMAGHRAKAEAMMKAIQNSGTQVASLDPAIGMASPQAIQSATGMNEQNVQRPPADLSNIQGIAPTMYVGEVGANGAISTKERPAANAIRKMLGGQEQHAPVQVAQAAPQGQVSEQQVVQELFGSPAPRPQLNPGMLMQALSDPNISEQNRATLQGLLQNEMKKADPAYQAQQQMDQIGLQKAQIELQKLQNPDPVAPKFENVGGRLVKINPDGSVSEAYAPPPEPEKVSKPAEIQEYEYAKGQGFPGTFQDWKASQKGGMALQVDPTTGAVTFQQGGNIKPMTEAQSKDTVYATRAEGALPILDQYANELTGVIGNTVGQLPLVGNAMKPEGFQKAEQASGEFLQAILRKDTGAAITADEQRLYGDTYLPRMGDGAEVLAQKQIARTRALEALKSGMTPQAILAQEKALAKVPQSAPAQAAPTEKKRFKFNPATGELE